jgi:hypothetical protein
MTKLHYSVLLNIVNVLFSPLMVLLQYQLDGNLLSNSFFTLLVPLFHNFHS